MRCITNTCLLHWTHGCNSCKASLKPKRADQDSALNLMMQTVKQQQTQEQQSQNLSVEVLESAQTAAQLQMPKAVPVKKQLSPNSVYMRELPGHTISFSSPAGKRLFKQALMAGTMENYFKLAEQFTTQADPAYCGPASLIMVLNSLQIDPNKTWKGIWRWYTEEVLHCTSQEIMANGMSLEEITQLARCNGLHTMTFKPVHHNPLFHEKLDSAVIQHTHSEPLFTTDNCCKKQSSNSNVSNQINFDQGTENSQPGNDHSNSNTNESLSPKSNDEAPAAQTKTETPSTSIPYLIQHNVLASYLHSSDFDLFQTAIQASAQIEGFQMIINLSRSVLGQSGVGHFCPVGGYNAETRKVLLLDTARFKYPPHWVDIELLYASICEKRGDGEPRGFICLARKASPIERKTLPPSQVRQPRLPNLDHVSMQDISTEEERGSNMLSVLNFLNQQSVKTLLFTYLFQVNDWFGTPQQANQDSGDETYLSRCMTYKSQIQDFLHERTTIFQKVDQCIRETLEAQGVQTLPILELFKRMVPQHQIEILCIVLLSLPQAMLENLAQCGDQEEELWMEILETRSNRHFNNEIALEINILLNAFADATDECDEMQTEGHQ